MRSFLLRKCINNLFIEYILLEQLKTYLSYQRMVALIEFKNSNTFLNHIWKAKFKYLS